MKLSDVILRDTRANQPGAASVPPGTLYYVTDETVWERSTGSAWEDTSTGAGVSDHGALTGLTDDDHSSLYPLITNFEADRATIATNWTDLTDGGATTLHSHAAASEANDIAHVDEAYNAKIYEKVLAGTNITITEQADGEAISIAASGTATTLNDAAVTNYSATFTSSGTSTAVTTTAFAAGSNLIAVVGSTGRGCDSITHANVTWTQRLTVNSGTRWAEIWTGVASSTTGTTATFAFTGANTQQCAVFQMPNTGGNFTSATSAASTNGTGTTASLSFTATEGNFYLIVYSGNNPASGYGAISHRAVSIGPTGGALSGHVFLADFSGGVECWRTFASSVGYQFVAAVMA